MILTPLASCPLRPLDPSPLFSSAALPSRSRSLPLLPFFPQTHLARPISGSCSTAGRHMYYLSSGKRHRGRNKSDPAAVFRHARQWQTFRRLLITMWRHYCQNYPRRGLKSLPQHLEYFVNSLGTGYRAVARHGERTGVHVGCFIVHRTPCVLCVTEDLSENPRSMNQHLTVAIWD